MERFLLRRLALPRPWLVFRSSLPSGHQRIADVSGECQSLGVLVYARGTRLGNGDYRCSGETIQCNWSPADRLAALVLWLALEFCRHRPRQPPLFRDVLLDLPQSERRPWAVSSGASIHSPRWRSTGRPAKNTKWRFSWLSFETAKGLRARAGMGRLQLHVLSPVNVAPQLSFRFPSYGLVPLCFLHERTLDVRYFHRSSGGRMAGGRSDPARLGCKPGSPNRVGNGNGVRSRDLRRGQRSQFCGRPALDQPCSGRTGCGGARGVDRSIPDCAAGKRRHTGRRRELLWSDRRYFCADRDRLYCLRNALLRRRLRDRDSNPAAGDCGLYFSAGTNRTHPRAGGKRAVRNPGRFSFVNLRVLCGASISSSSTTKDTKVHKGRLKRG